MVKFEFDRDTLYCFYDFRVSPSSFDFFTFLYSAENCRIRRNLKDIYLILVHGDKDKFRNDTVRSTQSNEVFFNNVIMPGVSFLPSISAFCWMPSNHLNINRLRKENIFPRGYELQKPVSEYIAHELVAGKVRGDKPGFFTSPNYAKNLAQEFLKYNIENKPFVTLTARELDRSDTNGTRKVDIKHWHQILKKIKDSGVVPLVIRDTQNAFSDPLFEDILEVNLASVHLPFRLAIYERALINFIKFNGPAALLIFSRSHSMHLGSFDNETNVAADSWYANHYGMSAGDQFPMSTNETEFLWNSEDPNYIVNSVKQKIELPNSERLTHNFSGAVNGLLSFQVAFSQFTKNIKYNVMQEDADLLKGLSKLGNDINLTYAITSGSRVKEKTNSIEEFLLSLEGTQIPNNSIKILKERFNLKLD